MRFAFLIVTVIVVADAATKVLMHNAAAGGGHPPQGMASPWAFAIAAAALAVPFIQYPAAVVVGGVLGNQLWTLRPAGVPNPFVEGATAYNLADISIVLGGYATAVAIVCGTVILWQRRVLR